MILRSHGRDRDRLRHRAMYKSEKLEFDVYFIVPAERTRTIPVSVSVQYITSRLKKRGFKPVLDFMLETMNIFEQLIGFEKLSSRKHAQHDSSESIISITVHIEGRN